MGVYDMLPDGQQVKCWENDFRTYQVGDRVPAINDLHNYQIALREGGYAIVEDCIFRGTGDGKEELPVFDKYGNPGPVDYGGPTDPFSVHKLFGKLAEENLQKLLTEVPFFPVKPEWPLAMCGDCAAVIVDDPDNRGVHFAFHQNLKLMERKTL